MTFKEVKEKHPVILSSDHDTTFSEYGFQHGKGWLPLIDDLCNDIEKYCEKMKIKIPVVSQVKQKLGGLRFYLIDRSDATISRMIHQAETVSYHVCESCGLPGHLGQKKLLATLCDPCRRDFGKDGKTRTMEESTWGE